MSCKYNIIKLDIHYNYATIFQVNKRFGKL